MYYKIGAEHALEKLALHTKLAVSDAWIKKRLANAVDSGVSPERINKFKKNIMGTMQQMYSKDLDAASPEQLDRMRRTLPQMLASHDTMQAFHPQVTNAAATDLHAARLRKNLLDPDADIITRPKTETASPSPSAPPATVTDIDSARPSWLSRNALPVGIAAAAAPVAGYAGYKYLTRPKATEEPEAV